MGKRWAIPTLPFHGRRAGRVDAGCALRTVFHCRSRHGLRLPLGDARKSRQSPTFVQFFGHLVGSLPDIKHEEHGGPSLAIIFGLIRRHSAVPARDVRIAVDWVIFNYLVSNADAHAKNLAMMPAERGKFRLAPWYDILCTDFYPRAMDRMAMRIGGEDRPDWVRDKNWRQFAADTGINPSLLRKRTSELGGRTLEALPGTAAGLGIAPDGRLAVHLGKTIRKRLRWALKTQEGL